jgi:hypothetical protein
MSATFLAFVVSCTFLIKKGLPCATGFDGQKAQIVESSGDSGTVRVWGENSEGLAMMRIIYYCNTTRERGYDVGSVKDGNGYVDVSFKCRGIK